MGYQIQFLSFFLKKKPILFDLNPKNRFWGHIFPHICGSVGRIVSKNNRVHPWVDPHQPCEFHENRIRTATCILTSYTYIDISILTLRICNQGSSKRKTWPPTSILVGKFSKFGTPPITLRLATSLSNVLLYLWRIPPPFLSVKNIKPVWQNCTVKITRTLLLLIGRCSEPW